MNKLLLIAFSNLKKKKGAMFIIAILIAFSSFLSYISISTLTNLRENADRSYEYSNLADVEFVMPDLFDEQILSVLDNREEIAQMERNSCLAYQMSSYKKTDSDGKNDFGVVIQNVQSEYEINKNTCDLDIKSFPENGIILSQYMSSTGAFQIGDPYILIIGDRTYHFEVVGFSENALFATPLNINMQIVFMSDKMYQTIEQDTRALAPNMYDYKIRLKSDISGDSFEKDVIAALTAKVPDLTNYSFCSVSWEVLYRGIIITPSIAMAIILVFAVLLMLIAISVIYYNIKNFMEENLPNIGILKASGYTSIELICSLLLEILSVTFLGIFAGLFAGFASAPLIGNLEASMMGILWRIGIDPLAALLASLLVLAMILTITLFLGRRYKSIFVLDALRGGIATHNFKKNHFPLETSGLPLLGNLGFKDIFYEKRKNICILVIVVFLTFASCAGVFIYQTFGSNSNNLLLLSGIEVSDIIVTTTETKYDELDLTTIEGIQDALYHNNMDITLMLNDKETTVDCDFWDAPEKLQNEMICEGRLPVNNNEIIISSLIANELDANVGDIVYVKENNKKIDYMIVGIDQKVNHLGRKAMMTFEGIHRYKPGIEPAGIYIVCKDGYDFDSLQDTLQTEFPSSTFGEGEKIISSLSSGVQTVMLMLCTLFLVTTLFIVFLVLMMVGKSRILEKKQQLGINKALGFTTKQLIRQNIISTVPVILLGGFIGMIFSYFMVNPILGICFTAFGIGSCNFPVHPLGFLIVVLGITLESLLVTLLTSAKIRDIEPINMIRNM